MFSDLSSAVATVKNEFNKSPQIMELYKNARVFALAIVFDAMMEPYDSEDKPSMTVM